MAIRSNGQQHGDSPVLGCDRAPAQTAQSGAASQACAARPEAFQAGAIRRFRVNGSPGGTVNSARSRPQSWAARQMGSCPQCLARWRTPSNGRALAVVDSTPSRCCSTQHHDRGVPRGQGMTADIELEFTPVTHDRVVSSACRRRFAGQDHRSSFRARSTERLKRPLRWTARNIREGSPPWRQSRAMTAMLLHYYNPCGFPNPGPSPGCRCIQARCRRDSRPACWRRQRGNAGSPISPRHSAVAERPGLPVGAMSPDMAAAPPQRRRRAGGLGLRHQYFVLSLAGSRNSGVSGSQSGDPFVLR